ncbi:MAG: porin family protein [Flavisolibacter sp.]
MKKIVFLLFFSLFCSFLFAQNARFGFKGGLNISELTNNESGNTASRAGFNAGALVNVPLTSNWSVQPEVVFSSQGGKYTVDNTEHKIYLNYVNIPILFQYVIDNGFRLETGPQVGFLVSAKDKVGNIETGYITSSDFKNVDASWAFGLAYISPSGLGVDGRYNLGLSNINNVGSATIHNGVFQVGLVYLLPQSDYSTHRTYSRTHYRRY